MKTKICINCGIEKPLTEFYFRKDNQKYQNQCKTCLREKSNKYRKENINKVKEFQKKYYEENHEWILNYHKDYREQNIEKIRDTRKKHYEKIKEKLKEYKADYYQKNKERLRKKFHEYYLENTEQLKDYQKEYRINNHEKYYKRKLKYKYNRITNDEIFKLKEQLRNMLRWSFRRKGYLKSERTKTIIGCDIDFLIKYLKETYKNNYGVEWDGKEKVHIDHIIPLATANSEEEIIKLCHYTNLQLLKAEDNLQKNDKLDWNLKEK